MRYEERYEVRYEERYEVRYEERYEERYEVRYEERYEVRYEERYEERYEVRHDSHILTLQTSSATRYLHLSSISFESRLQLFADGKPTNASAAQSRGFVRMIH